MKSSIVTRTTEGGFRVGIMHSRRDSVVGADGYVVAWLMTSGNFAMPSSSEQARKIKVFPDAKTAGACAEKWFSIIPFLAEMRPQP